MSVPTTPPGPAPTGPTNTIRIGYARISTRAQDHLSQLEALAAAHCREIVEETASTRKDRPKLHATVTRMHPGDTLVIYKPDRIARSVKELLVFLEDELAPRGVNLEILSGICTGLHRPSGQTIADKMLFLVAAMAAEMERDLISERTLDGLAAARAHGRVGGRPPALDADKLAAARARRARGESITAIARHLKVGRSTLYRALENDEPPLTPAAATAPKVARPGPATADIGQTRAETDARPAPPPVAQAADGVPAPATRPTPPASARPPTRPPKGLLSEPLWRVLAELHAAGPAGLDIGRHMGAWQYLEEGRGRGFVTTTCPPDGRPSRSDRRWLSAAGREHIAAHAERYAALYPQVVLREPGSPALDELDDAGLWQTLVDVATAAAEPTPIPGWEQRPYRGASLFRERLHDRGLVTDEPTSGGYRLTEAGRVHYAAHWATYGTRYPDIDAPHPDDVLPATSEQATLTEATEAVQQDDNDAQAVRQARPGAAWEDADVCLARVDGQWHLHGPDGEIEVEGFGFFGHIPAKNEKQAKEAAADTVAALTGQKVTSWDPDAVSRFIRHGESTWYACLSEPPAAPAVPAQKGDDDVQDHGHEDSGAARIPQLRAVPRLGEDYQTARWPHQPDRVHLLHLGQPIGYVTGYTGRWRALTPDHDPITLDAIGPDATHRTQASALAAIALHARHQETRHPAQPGELPATAAVDDRQALTEAPGEGLAEQRASAVLPAAQQAQTAPDEQTPELYLARLHGQTFLLLADAERVGWLHAEGDGWQVHGRDGRLVTTLRADGVLNAAALAAAALNIPGAARATVTAGPLTDDRGRSMDTSPTSLASWSLLKGRVAGRTDVIVRGRCVGWLQRDDRGRDVACTLDGPVPGSAGTNRVQAVTALLAALLAPAPLPELGPEARTARRPRARSPRERPISPFTPALLAAAAFTENLQRLPDGSYRVHIDDGYDDTDLGRVFRSGRRWQALAPDGRVVVHRAATRTEAVDQLLATPGPIFGDGTDTILHDL
ncbi:recombinase family protein [Nonomuraea sp. NPDC059194]|uniref:recombinase family protein n=1 Tax=Nonomuraea sp. NPDC059194 TaxID=3346764 RepID=UPI0036A4B419